MTVKKEIIVRFGFVYALAVLIMIPILLFAGNTIFKEGDFWRSQGAKSKIDSLIVTPNRGNILACDGKLLASSIPSYKLYMDFNLYTDSNGVRVRRFDKKALDQHIESISATLATIYKNKSREEIKKHLLQGYKKKSSWYLLDPQNISYTDLQEVNAHPYFKKGPNISGLCVYEQVSRKKPFGSLASRTIGGLYGEMDKGGSSGLEMKYDSLLRGKAGISSRQKIAGKFRSINEVDPVDGLDIKTTIDINIQDITESALLNELLRVDAERGCAVVMEVKTGEIKAISNLRRVREGRYEETQNFAVSSQTEPGSTFKVASIMAALDDGVIDTSYKVDTENGIWKIRGKEMKDHNWDRGEGYGKISVAQAIWYSSNIGISKMIYERYNKKPERFVERIYSMKLNEPINLEIPGAGKPRIKHPGDSTAKWSWATLPWMSIGYETQIPPIYTLTFYNAIANNGKMIKPFFVKAICRNGDEIEQFSTEVINPAICSQNTLKKVRCMLVDVVEKGTAKPAGSDNFQIAGKTGTAQVDYWKKNNTKTHQLTFCGYFPADAPKYSSIVVVWSPGKAYPSAGSICGPVFKNIAERIYAQSPLLQSEPKSLCDTAGVQMPVTKDGKRKELQFVLDKLNIPYTFSGTEQEEWIFSEARKDNINMRTQTIYTRIVPNAVGMGARDAVYLLENKGLQVRISGRGKVTSQSIEPGKAISKGDIIQLQLQ